MRREAGAAARAALLLLMISGDARAQSAEAGKTLFKTCAACHALGAGQHRTGPSLAGVVGRKAGAAEGFTYSDAMLAAGAAGLTWTPETLDQYLADPVALVPESKMAWQVEDAAERRDLIAYLETLK